MPPGTASPQSLEAGYRAAQQVARGVSNTMSSLQLSYRVADQVARGMVRASPYFGLMAAPATLALTRGELRRR